MGEFLSVEEKVEFAEKAEKYGLTSAWTQEHYYHRDSLVTSTAIACRTKRIRIGTSIVNPFTRHPALLAMAAATINEFSRGRFTLGLGLGLSVWNEDQLGIPMGSPSGESLREACTLTKLLLQGNTVTFEGKRFKVMNVKLGSTAPNTTPPPVYVAAVGQQLLRIAGSVGDGVILPTCATVNYIRNSMPIIKQALHESNRMSTEVVCLSFISISEHSEVAKKEIRPHLFPTLLRRGREKLMFPRSKDQQMKIKKARDAMSRGDEVTASKLISDDIVDSVSIAGDQNECVRSIGRFRNTGITELVLVPV